MAFREITAPMLANASTVLTRIRNSGLFIYASLPHTRMRGSESRATLAYALRPSRFPMLDLNIVYARAFLLWLQSNLHASRCSICYARILCNIAKLHVSSIHDGLRSLLPVRACTSACANASSAELAFMHRCADMKFPTVTREESLKVSVD